MESGSGHIFILSAPSGAGKTTLGHALREKFPHIGYSISHTTRPPRKGETDGEDYYFISRQDFQEGIRSGHWAEWARVHDHYYGTSAAFLDQEISHGHDVLLDIDVQGTRQLLKRYPGSITIFIMPPDLPALRKRLETRGADSPETIKKRLAAAEEEINQRHIYRHIIINDHLPEAITQLCNVIRQYTSPSRPKDPSVS